LAVVLAASPGAAQEEKDAKAEKFDPAKLVGTWDYVSAEKNGAKADAESLKKQGNVTITKETITLKNEAGKFVMKYTLDAKKSPVGIEMEMTESPFGAGAKSKGIIELKGDDLKFCYNPDGDGAAPTEFKTKEGGSAHYFVLKRSK
jgi:uncharacterized protein (TIGR03067 family)